MHPLTSGRIARIYFKALPIFSLFSAYFCSSFCDVSSLFNYERFCFPTLSCSFILCLVICFLFFFNGPVIISASFLLYIALVVGNVLHFW